MAATRLIRTLTVLATAVGTLLLPQAAQAGSSGRVDFGAGLQPIDGFGVAAAFQRASLIEGAQGLTPRNRRQVLDLLFSRTTGVGASILRIGVGSSADGVFDHMKSIEPTDPGGPDATPQYVFDGTDGGQVQLARQAEAYGLRRIYADAWSPPGFMKDNGDDANGGTLCGLSGTNCTADWRRAYADYLLQYVRFYRAAGIPITDLGFTNEPDFTATYASMRLTPQQAAEFLTVLGPRARSSGLPVKLTCCDSFGWNEAMAYTKAVEADPQAARWVSTFTGHSYASSPAAPQPAGKPAWMSEWNPNGNAWDVNWDDGGGFDGFTVAQNIHDSLVKGSASAYVYWFAVSTGATRALIQLDGANYQVSARLWALAAYSRFIRPGATRVRADSPDADLEISAFKNADGGRVIEILNTATTNKDLTLDGVPGSRVTTYRTDNGHSLARTDDATAHGGNLTAHLAPRSLTTVTLGR